MDTGDVPGTLGGRGTGWEVRVVDPVCDGPQIFFISSGRNATELTLLNELEPICDATLIANKN
jgi:hypothetical protein